VEITNAPNLPGGTVNEEYAGFQHTAEGGLIPYAWGVVNGDTPPGLNFNQNGSVTGTPTQSGTYNWTIRVDDSNERFDTQAESMTIQD
jgi:hypothetical protein